MNKPFCIETIPITVAEGMQVWLTINGDLACGGANTPHVTPVIRSPMKTALLTISFVMLFAACALPGRAADILPIKTKVEGLHLDCDFALSGLIETGDIDRVRSLGAAHGCVVLNSRGGSYSEALKIAEHFIDQGVGTVVRAGDACLSACAIIFLSGASKVEGVTRRNRYMHIMSTVGFHAPFLEVRSRQYSKETIENAHKTGLLSVAKLLALEPNNTAVDHEFFPKELVAEMAKRQPSESFLIDTIKKAIKFKVELFGAPDLAGC